MARYLLRHHHERIDCGAAYAAWKGFESPLRRRSTIASCFEGGHAVWWDVDAFDANAALALFPPFVAVRATLTEVSEVQIP